MKAFLALFAASLLLTAASKAAAASAVEFSVTGKISPGACYPTLSNHAVDFGEIKIGELLRHTATVIERPRFNTLNISCDGATLFGIRGVDDRASSVGNHWYPSAYGLGFTPKGEKIGAHYVEVQPARSTIDGRMVFTTYSDARGERWDESVAAESAIPNDGQLLGLTNIAGNASGPVPIKQASLGLTHYLVVAPADSLTLTHEVALDGKATIELIYL